MFRNVFGLVALLIVCAGPAVACDLALVDGLTKRGFTNEQITDICKAAGKAPAAAAKSAQESAADAGGTSSPGKVGGAAAPDRLMERPTPIKIDEPIEFMRGYWKVTWRVTNVPNFPPREVVWRFRPQDGKLALSAASWEKVEGSLVPKVTELQLHAETRIIPKGIWLDLVSRRVSSTSSQYVGVGILSVASYSGPADAPAMVIDLSSPTSRDAVRGGFVERVGASNLHSREGWPLIGELEFERIPEDKLVEVLKSLN